jgi:hypothetical protein
VIKYDPSRLLSRIAPQGKIKKLISRKLTVKKAALSFLDDLDFVNKAEITRLILKVIKNYEDRIDDEPGLKDKLLKNPALLIQRVQSAIVTQVTEEIRDKYRGEYYVWLPSDADEPDPEHQLKYGKKYQVGVGEMPGDRFGCRCGMEILVDEKQLKL